MVASAGALLRLMSDRRATREAANADPLSIIRPTMGASGESRVTEGAGLSAGAVLFRGERGSKRDELPLQRLLCVGLSLRPGRTHSSRYSLPSRDLTGPPRRKLE